MSSTDSADEVTGTNTANPPRKRRRIGHLNVKIKKVVLNVYKTEILKNPDIFLGDIEERVAHKTGICNRSVRNIIKEYKITGTLSAPKSVQNRRTTFDSICNFDKTAIRGKVYDFFFRNESPSIVKVLQAVNNDPNLPNFKKTTFLKILKKLKFKFQKCQNSSLLLDRDEIRRWRRGYLTTIKRYRNENRKIYYLGETWINAGHTKPKKSVTSSRQACLDSFSVGLKNPSDKGLIICHVGSENGFLPDALCIFELKKSRDSNEMDCPSFEKWFSSILPKLEANSVIVLDDAPYHCRKLYKIPRTSSKKCDIQEWLYSKNIPFDDTMVKAQLLRLVNDNKKQYNKYIVDEMAKAENKIVLRLPPYHCILSPIEFVWSDIKHFVADKTSFKFADVLQEAILHITPDKWKKCVQYVWQEMEVKMWQIDNIMDEAMEPCINDIA
ncbi:uncharacterized protein LOC108909842 [Anoplophora glabripennis]|uniref:uncharacterized protein LOC108909842 n=1 Tax=Anoplophora glabripennis TaxID=217634 RepID=UPI0008738F7F|nr:uncharacterized protein LOC108909842 [Anoplophora glabripennis]XP_018569786.1 uncharacterized protein LOC108909842 [Anoplophora glabripennis]